MQSRRWHPRVVQSATCPVRELSSPRVDQSARCPVRELAIRELSSNRLFSGFCRAHACDRPTDRQTDRPRYSVCNNKPHTFAEMRCGQKTCILSKLLHRFQLEVCGNDFLVPIPFPLPYNHSHSHPFPFQHSIPIPMFSHHLYSHSHPFPFPYRAA